MLTVYRIAYFLLKYLICILKPFLSNDLKKWIDLRNKKINTTLSNHKKIMFHAASGEIEYIKSVIREFKNRHPDVEIILTYSSPSAEKLFTNLQSEVTAFIPLPWDTPTRIQNLLMQLKPELIVFSRTDFWPELIYQAHKKNIPLIGVSMYPRFGFFQNIWLKFILKKFSLLTAVSEATCKQLESLLPNKNMTYLPDTRFDQVIHRLNSQSKIELITNKKVVVFGSTWPEDERILVECVDQILKNNFRIVWCPHDVSKSRIEALTEQLKKYSVSKFSDGTTTINFETDVLILDQIGFLADAYRFSQISFVGGSFKTKVHSVMEPLCAGNTVIIGPYYKNNPEAVQFLEKKYVYTVSNSTEFLSVFENIQKGNQASEIKNTMIRISGSSEKMAILISEYLSKTT